MKSENKEKKAKAASARHIALSVVGVILCIILIPVLIINVTLIIKSYTDSDNVPNVGGWLPMIVLTDSMYPEIESGDLIICHTAEADEIEVGDIIAFFEPSGGTNVVSHRVADIVTQDGELYFQTKGDNNNIADSDLVPADNLVGKCVYIISGAGNAAMFMQTTQGLIICVICPLVLLIIYDVIRRRIYEKKKNDDTAALLAELEELKKLKAEKTAAEQNANQSASVESEKK